MTKLEIVSDVNKIYNEIMRNLAVVIQNKNQGVTPEDTINTVKNVGFRNVFVQWYDRDWECSQEEQVRLCQKLGLNIIFAHLGYDNINSIWKEDSEGDKTIENYKKNIKDCHENGIPMVIMHLISKNLPPMYNEIGLKRLKDLNEYAKNIGVKIAFENTKTKGYLEYVLGNIDDENIGICFDVGHYHAHFNDEFNFELFKNKIFAVHLHDNDKSDDQHLLPFDGTIDWEFVMRKLKECNYNGPITLELCYRNDYLKMSLEEFYKEGYERGLKLQKLIEDTK